MFWRISLPRLGHPLRLAGRWVCVGTTSMTPLPFQRASVLEFRKFTGRISENSDFVLDSHSCAFCLPLDPLRQGSVMFPFQAMLPLSDPGTDYEGGRFFVQPGKRDVGRQYCQELLTGDLIIFRSGLYHGVEPLTRGRRFAIAMQFALSHLNENPSLPRRTWEEKMELEKQQSAQTELEQPPLG
ncbi:unnamed protein product [Effrenium voratum]|nr:unnamed protein product [Effrenium voratum]